LSEEHREVITLARVVRLPHALVGEALGRSEEAARQLLVRALTRLACIATRHFLLGLTQHYDPAWRPALA
jgi:DNA-directed RNA polymerase specialized sigma24 family protein